MGLLIIENKRLFGLRAFDPTGACIKGARNNR